MIRFKVRQTSTIPFKVNPSANVPIDVDSAVIVRGDSYPFEGPYEVTPGVDAQSMATKDKFMKDDVTIKAIPYYDVGNNSGGSTVYIGKEI